MFSSGCSGSPIFLPPSPPPVSPPSPSTVEDVVEFSSVEVFVVGRVDLPIGVEGTLANAEGAAEYEENADLTPPEGVPNGFSFGFAAEAANPEVEANAENGEFELRGLEAGVEGAARFVPVVVVVEEEVEVEGEEVEELVEVR